MDFFRPRGDITTVLDQVTRDEQDNTLFPLSAETTLFARTPGRRTHPFSTVIREFTCRGAPNFGNRFTFDIGSLAAGDLLMSVLIQVQLGHWLPDYIIAGLQNGTITYDDPSNDAYTWCNSLGTALIEKAELEIGDHILETVDGDFANVFSLLFPDINSQFGIGADALGRTTQKQQQTVTPQPFPTGTNGIVTCILPFFFQRTRLNEAFPLASCHEGTVRLNITFRPFVQLIKKWNRANPRTTCDETPLNRTIQFNGLPADLSGNPINTYTTPSYVPEPQDVLMVTYSAVVGGTLRDSYLRQAHDLLFRETQTFRFSEPLTYVLRTTGESVTIQLPLEANGPIEEIIWFVRRKGTAAQNEWTNYSSTLASEYDALTNPYKGLVIAAKIQVNGIDLVEAEGDYFRAHIAEKHRGGITAFENFLYGYSFARHPGEHQPSGALNASRMNTLRLTLEIAAPVTPSGGTDEWEVVVYCMGLNWVRFENGIVNRIFSD